MATQYSTLQAGFETFSLPISESKWWTIYLFLFVKRLRKAILKTVKAQHIFTKNICVGQKISLLQLLYFFFVYFFFNLVLVDIAISYLYSEIIQNISPLCRPVKIKGKVVFLFIIFIMFYHIQEQRLKCTYVYFVAIYFF